MRFDRLLSILALLAAIGALAVAIFAVRRDPLGTDLARYDLSSPEKAIHSVHRIVANRDLRAGWQMFQANMLRDPSPETQLFFAAPSDIKVVKSIEVQNSASPKNDGLVVSFVTFKVAGVDYRSVQYFRKELGGRFQFASGFYVPFGTEPNEDDKVLQAQIEEFKKTGKL